MKKTVVILLAIVFLGTAGYLGYQNMAAKSNVARKPQYTTAAARYEKIESKVSAPGTVEPLNRDTLKAENRATIDEVLVKENSTVKKDALLISFKNNSNDIKAPFDGVVAAITVKADDTVIAGQELLQIFDNKNFITRINVDELDLPSIKLGQKAAIKVNAFPSAAFTGIVTDIGQEGTSANGVSTFQITIRFSQIGKIKSGMTTEATIVTAVKQKALVIPIEAVKTVNGQRMVSVVTSNGTAADRKVEIGINSTTMVEITKGLTAGEKVQLPQVVNNEINQMKSPRGFQMQGGQKRSNETNGTSGQTPAKAQ